MGHRGVPRTRPAARRFAVCTCHPNLCRSQSYGIIEQCLGHGNLHRRRAHHPHPQARGPRGGHQGPPRREHDLFRHGERPSARNQDPTRQTAAQRCGVQGPGRCAAHLQGRGHHQHFQVGRRPQIRQTQERGFCAHLQLADYQRRTVRAHQRQHPHSVRYRRSPRHRLLFLRVSRLEHQGQGFPAHRC